MIVFESYVCFSYKALKAVNWCLYNFIEPVIDLMDIFHLNPENYAEMVNELGDYFPEYLIREEPRLCIDTLLDLAAWTQDDFMHKMSAVHEYALYQILYWECQLMEEMGEEGSELLKSCFAYPDMEKIPSPEFEYFEAMSEYGFDVLADYLFRDTDFLSVDHISSWELTNTPINQMLGVDIDHLRPLFPRDIRDQLDEIYDNNRIFQTLSTIQTVLSSLERTPALLEDKTEQEINAQIATGLNLALSRFGLGVSQEIPFGYSPTGVGEVDFYVCESQWAPQPTAIGESKVWNGFKKSLDQLMGYMNENVDLGFTIAINRHQRLSDVLEKQKLILESYSVGNDAFRALDIHESKFGGWICLHEHPENGRQFLTNHFILNLFRPSRKEAAASRRKTIK